MKTAIFITVGTRDLVVSDQIDKNLKLKEQLNISRKFNNVYWLGSPKKDGEIINKSFDSYNPFLDYPIIRPALEEIIEMGETGIIDQIFLIFTDQSRAKISVENRFVEKDSINLAFVIEKKIKLDFANKVKSIKKIPITDNVAFYDNMYSFFGEKFYADKKIKSLAEKNAKVFVLPQGGIASINTTLLLRCAEFFTDITQLSKPEGFETPVNSSFPKLFKRNLIRERIKQALENFEYSTISSYQYSPFITTLAQYTFSRITFNFSGARKILFQYKGAEDRHYLSQLKSKTREIEKNEELRFKEWYLMTKVSLRQKKYSDFLLKMFNLSENILKPFAEKELGGKIIFNTSDNHKEWNNLLDKQSEELKNFLENTKVRGRKLFLSRPTRFAYKAIFDFYSSNEKQSEYDSKIHNNLESLADLRNQVGHNLIGIGKDDINKALKANESSIEDLINNLDQYFQLKDYGIYDSINQKIIDHLK